MEAESLSAACELAFSVARDGVEATPPVDPPTPMRSFLYVAQLPKRAMTVAQRVMDEDPEFRAQVAQAATPESVGEVGHLWLTRPDGWEASIEAATSAAEAVSEDAGPEAETSSADVAAAEGSQVGEVAASESSPPPPPPPPPGFTPTPSPAAVSGEVQPVMAGSPGITSSDSIREELDSLQGLVTRLSDERRQVSSEVETVEASADGGISVQIEALRQDLADIRAERDRAQDQKELSIVRQAELADEIAELRRLIASLKEERAGIQATLAQAEEQVAGVQIVVADLETQRDQVIGERNALTVERDELTMRRDELMAQTESLTSERASLTSEVSDLSSQRDSLTFERDNLVGERDDLTVQLGQAGSNAEALELQISDISGQADELQMQFETLSAERAAVGAELERLNIDVADNSRSRQTMVEALAGQIAELKGERDVLASNLEQSQQTLASLRSAFSSATETLSTEIDRVDSANTEVSATQSSLSAALEGTSARLDDLITAPEVTAPNMGVLDSSLAEDAGKIDFVADIPEAPKSSFVPSTDGPSYTAPAAPVIGGLAASASEDVAADISEFASQESTFTTPSVDDVETDGIASDIGTSIDGDIDAGAASDIDPASVFSGVAASNAAEDDELDVVGEEIAAELGHPTPPPPPPPAAPTTDVLEQTVTPEALAGSAAVAGGRRMIEIPESLDAGSKGEAEHVVGTPDVVVLVQGDAVASMGWPAMTIAEQRGALVTYLNILAGDTGAAPDVMFDSAVAGHDAMPESRVVRIRLSEESGGDIDQLGSLINSYPEEWPVAVVTDDEVLAAMAITAGAAVLNNGQLLDLFD